MNIRTAAFVASLALFACKGATETDTDTDTPTPTGPACETVSNQFPGDQSPAVYYRTAFTWSFTAIDNSAAVTLTDDGGTAVTGTGSFTGNTYVWNPDTALAPSTTYNLSLSFCDGNNTADTSFTTSPVGGTTDDTTLTGKTYLLDLTAPDVNFIEPPGVGGLLQSQLDGVTVLVGVNGIVGTDIDMIGAIGEGDPPTQDLCTESIPFPLADFSENPYFEIGPEDTTITVADISVSIDGLKISGAFDPGQTVIAGAVLEGSIDTRPLVDLLQPGGEPDAVCGLVGQFGIDCEDCGGGEVFCLSLKVNNINAEELVGTTVVVRDTATIEADTVNCPPPAP